MIAKGTLRLPKNRSDVIREACGISGGIWIQNKLVPPVCGQQDGGRETAHSVLAQRGY